MKRRGFIAVLLCFLLTLATTPTAFAEDSNESDLMPNNEKMLVNEDLALEMGERFFSNISPDEVLTIDEPVKFFNKEGQATGFIVHAYDANGPYGYVIFDSEHPDGISEFSFGPDAVSPYYTAVGSQGSQDSILRSASEQRVYKIDDLTYGVIDVFSGEGINNFGEEIDSKADDLELKSMSSGGKPGSWFDVFLDVTTVYKDYDVIAANSISGYTMYGQATAEQQAGRYACDVSASITAASYYVPIGNFRDDYLRMWDLTGTTTSSVQNGITYGTTMNGANAPAVSTFCTERGVNVHNNYNFFGNFGMFRNCIDTRNIAIFAAHSNTLEGHAMAVVGYMVLQGKNGGINGMNVLTVYDGWDSIRMLNLNPTFYARMNCSTFSR